jgi:hypothetical protein
VDFDQLTSIYLNCIILLFVDDEYQGDDGSPRTVDKASLCSNEGTLYSITPAKGSGQNAFIVNEDHILVLKLHRQPKIERNNSDYRVQYYALDHEGDLHRTFRTLKSQCDANRFVLEYC